MSKEIVGTAPPLGTSVHGHLVVGKGGRASLKALRLI
jgi:DNA repair protein RadC